MTDVTTDPARIPQPRSRPGNDLVGRRFGKLVVVDRVAATGGSTLWDCRCDCGTATTALTGSLSSGNTRSCGCGMRPVQNWAGPACGRPTKLHPNGRTGTSNGYFAHRYAKEEPCTACLEGAQKEAAAKRRGKPGYNLDSYLKRFYRLTLDDFEALLRRQGGKCAICGTQAPRDPRISRFHVDHDHSCCPPKTRTCGKCIRGLLCHACNTGIGLLNDDLGRLQAAMDYLKRRPSEPLPAAAVGQHQDTDPG